MTEGDEEEFDPAKEWPQVRVLRFTPLDPINRDEQLLAELQARKTVERVTHTEQIGEADIEVKGRTYLGCWFMRPLTEPGGPEIIDLLWDREAPVEDRSAAVGAVWWVCAEQGHDPPRPWALP